MNYLDSGSNNGSFKKSQRPIWSNHKIGSIASYSSIPLKDSRRTIFAGKANDPTAASSSFTNNTPMVANGKQTNTNFVIDNNATSMNQSKSRLLTALNQI